MGSYIADNLQPDEQILYSGNVSIWSLSPSILLGILSLPLLGIGLFFLISAAIRYYTTEIAVTNLRVVAKFGLISRHTIEIAVTRVESVQVSQSIFGRIFNFGTLCVSGAGTPQATLLGIYNPLAFHNAVINKLNRS